MSARSSAASGAINSTARFIAFGVAVALATGLLGLRLATLQVAAPAAVPAGERTEPPRAERSMTAAARGEITDRHGQPLVRNVPRYDITVRAAELPLTRRAAVLGRLARLLDSDAVSLTKKLDARASDRFEPVVVARDVSRGVAQLVAEGGSTLPGVSVEVGSRREYPFGALVSQVVGHTGAVSEAELRSDREAGYVATDQIGRAGVERTYETVLRGRPGRGSPAPAATEPAVSGGTLELSTDLAMQRRAETALRWALDRAGLRRGTFIAMDPQTGEVLALVSLPSYDNNLFARGISQRAYQRLLADPQRPLLNHAIAEQFPPGSTYKLVTASGALADGVVSDKTELDTRPFVRVGRDRYYEWNRRGWGPLSMLDAFGHSSDTFFFQLARRLGIDRLAHWARDFGFGAPTGIDLPGEAAGVVPSNAWKQRRFGERIFPGETLQAGIGQGFDAATPLQVLNAYAALANGGRLYRPHVVRRVLRPDGTVESVKPQLIRRLAAPPAVLRTMRRAARRVVTIRHTYNLVDLPLVVAGKSGTAEFGVRDLKGRLPFHSWFAAFVPAQPRPSRADPEGMRAVSRTDSRLAVVAFLYDSRTKGNAATEVVKYFLQLQYALEDDLRNFDLVERGNFYGGN